ncbi:uncharacterized protein LOC142352926 [Convolutriloba macropyga]|uniref:uncharacterized protein LOC142352926 n=1 Tax=Convolutriloba macropyga TaxID=536237 RepID=UPI003F51F173
MGEYLSFDPDATVADMSIADLFLEDLMFFWRALTLDEWTGLTDEQEKTVAIVYLSMKASVTETAPEIYAKLAICDINYVKSCAFYCNTLLIPGQLSIMEKDFKRRRNDGDYTEA